MTTRPLIRGVAICLLALLLLVWSLTSVITIMVSRPYTRTAVKVVTPRMSEGRQKDIDEAVAYAGSGGSGRLGFLSIEERSHMRDVAGVFTGARAAAATLWAFAAALAVVLLTTGCWREFLALLKWAVVGAEALLVLLLMASMVDFEWLFSKFHRVFFPQGNWSFSPDSALITLFPQSFWLLSTEVLVVGTVLMLAGVGVAAHALSLSFPRKRESSDLASG